MTATGKQRKKAKLRHAEYYGLQEIFDKLYADSKNGRIFKDLMPLITAEENIKLAYRNIRKNKGSRTAPICRCPASELPTVPGGRPTASPEALRMLMGYDFIR